MLIVNYLMQLKDYQLATQVMQEVAGRHSESLVVQNALGRLLLQVGSVIEAKAVFLQIRAAYIDRPGYQAMIAINESVSPCFISLFFSVFPDAYLSLT